MRRALVGFASLALVFLTAASLVASRPGPDTLDGFVHDITDPRSQAPGRTFGLFPSDDTSGGQPVVLVAGEHTADLVALLGCRVMVRGQWLEAPLEIVERRFGVEEIYAADGRRLADAIRNDLASRGDVFGELGTSSPQGGFDADKLTCPSGAPARRVLVDAPPPNTADFFTVTAYLCTDTGSYWAVQTGGIAGLVRWVGPFDLPARDEGLRGALLRDLDRRGASVFFDEGAATPGGGFGAEDASCPNGHRALVVDLALPEPGSADMFTDRAFVCAADRTYWAHREGGFAGVSLWIGPYDLPDDAATTTRSEDAPTRVSPRSLRTGRRDRTRRITIRRRIRNDDEAPRDASRYENDDFDLGRGVDVLRVLRVRRNSVRLRVLIDRDAERGARAVRVLGRAGDATLRLR
jgi:hypothetical protein